MGDDRRGTTPRALGRYVDPPNASGDEKQGRVQGGSTTIGNEVMIIAKDVSRRSMRLEVYIHDEHVSGREAQ